MSEWVDLQLSHQIASVKAPDDLWSRIESGRPTRRRRVVPRIALATAAAILAAIAVAYSATKPHVHAPATPFASTTCNACHTM